MNIKAQQKKRGKSLTEMMKTHADLNTSRGAGKRLSGETNQCNHRRGTKDKKAKATWRKTSREKKNRNSK